MLPNRKSNYLNKLRQFVFNQLPQAAGVIKANEMGFVPQIPRTQETNPQSIAISAVIF